MQGLSRIENKTRKRWKTIKIEVKEKNEETGEIDIVGTLNAIEVNYLVQYAINTLMAQGVQFDLDKEAKDNELRIKFPVDATLQ